MMASDLNMECEFADHDEIQLRRQMMVTEEVTGLFRELNIKKNEIRLKTLIEDNPWLLDKVITFSRTQEKNFHEAQQDLEKMLMDKESKDKRWNFYSQLALKHKKCQTEWLALAWHHAIIMKMVHLMYLNQGCQWDLEFPLIVQEKLLNSIKDYENSWKDVAPYLSCKILTNSQTSEKHIHICFKNFDNRFKRQLVRKRQMTAMKNLSIKQNKSEKENQPVLHAKGLRIQSEGEKQTLLKHAMVYLPFAQYKRQQELEINKRKARKEGREILKQKFRQVSELLCVDHDEMVSSEHSSENQSSLKQSRQSINKLQRVMSELDLN